MHQHLLRVKLGPVLSRTLEGEVEGERGDAALEMTMPCSVDVDCMRFGLRREYGLSC